MATSVVTTLLTHPFDLVRARRHAKPPLLRGTATLADYGGDLREIGRIARNEGISGLYRGVGTHFFGHVTSAVVFYWAEALFKKALWVSPAEQQQQRRITRMTRRFVASTLAGFCQVCATHPLWVVKNREQLSRRHTGSGSGGDSGISLSNNPVAALVRLGRKEGLRGLYAGLIPSLALTAHTSVQYAAYDELKRSIVNAKASKSLSSIDRFFAGIASKSVAVLVSNPMLMVRTRLMEENSAYTGTGQAFKTIWRDEGPRAFFRGTSAALWKVLAAGISLPFFDAAIAHCRHIFA